MMTDTINEEATLEAVADDLRSRMGLAADYAASVVMAEAPVGKTGKLRAEIYSVIDQKELKFRVVVPAFYASFAEFADLYRPGVKQRHNPFLQRGMMRAEPGIMAIMGGEGQ